MRLAILLLVLGTLAVYSPVTHQGFSTFDDDKYVSQNAMVQQGLSLDGIQWAFFTWHAGNWHPLTWLSLMLDCQLFGVNPGAEHVVNVLFHVANTVLLFLLAFRWIGKIWPCAFVAALFAWHPLHVESVAWISERKDVLSTFFALLALLAYTRYVRSRIESRGSKAATALDPRPSTFDYSFSLFFFACSLMAKPMFVTLPFVMLLLNYWPWQRGVRGPAENASSARRAVAARLMTEMLPFLVLSLACCWMTFVAQKHGGMVKSLTLVPLTDRLAAVPVDYLRYLSKIFWPEHLSIYYPLIHAGPVKAIAAAAVLVLASAAAWRLRRSHPYVLVGWLWFLGTLVPVIGLVQVGGASIADRYTYFPAIGIFLMVVLGTVHLAQRFRFSPTAPGTAGAVALALCLLLTARQLRFWRDSVALFSHAIDVVGDNGTLRVALGSAYKDAGQKSRAITEFRAATAFNLPDPGWHRMLGDLLSGVGQAGDAAREYQIALQLNPQDVESRLRLGTALVQTARADEALAQFAEVARLNPQDWRAPFFAGRTLLQQGRDSAAIPQLEQAVRDDGDNFPAVVLLAQVLATDNDPHLRDGARALTLANQANEFHISQPAVLDTVAMAYAELSRFDQAQQTAQSALDLMKQFGATNDVNALEQRVNLYKNHQPFRQSFIDAPTDGQQ